MLLFVLLFTQFTISPKLQFTLQISPSLSVSSNSSRKGKVGITIKKSPDTTGGERGGTKFETSLLGGGSSSEEEEVRHPMRLSTEL